jgi:hypothetical protein
MLDIHGRTLYLDRQFSDDNVPLGESTPLAVDVVRPAWIGSLVAVRLLSPSRSIGLVPRAWHHAAAFCVVHPRFSGE